MEAAGWDGEGEFGRKIEVVGDRVWSSAMFVSFFFFFFFSLAIMTIMMLRRLSA